MPLLLDFFFLNNDRSVEIVEPFYFDFFFVFFYEENKSKKKFKKIF